MIKMKPFKISELTLNVGATYGRLKAEEKLEDAFLRIQYEKREIKSRCKNNDEQSDEI